MTASLYSPNNWQERMFMAVRLRRITNAAKAMEILKTGRLKTFSSNLLNADSGANFLPVGGYKSSGSQQRRHFALRWLGPQQVAADVFPYAPNFLHRAGKWRDVVPLNSNPALLQLVGIKFDDWALDEYIAAPLWALAVKLPTVGEWVDRRLVRCRSQARAVHRARVRALLRSKPRLVTVC